LRTGGLRTGGLRNGGLTLHILELSLQVLKRLIQPGHAGLQLIH
jgi:hypothetical protein